MTRLAALLVLSVAFILFSLAKGRNPKISETAFDGAATTLFYFEDSDIVIFTDQKTKLVYRSVNAGESWKIVDSIPEHAVRVVVSHPVDKRTAVAVGETKHWITEDCGDSWISFLTKGEISTLDRKQPIEFHATDSKKMLFHTASCNIFGCEDYKAWYTTDGFKTSDLLRADSQFCIWAKSRVNFSAKDKKMDADGVICVVAGMNSWYTQDRRLLVSNDYFRSNEIEPNLANGRAVAGIVSIATTKAYIVAAAKSEGASELAFYVTTDLDVWQRAQFGEHRVEENAYSLLESTDYSMQVDVLATRSSNPVGALFTSNSEGTYFTKNIDNTNRNRDGWVDFEKVSNIQGIVLVNIVENWKAIEKDWTVEKKVKSRISINDGRSFIPLLSDGETVHLHSITEMHNVGRLFSSPAPGLVMGVGNKGDFLEDYDGGDLYVSDDAGVSWRKALDKPHLREFGDQGGILVAVAQGIDTNIIHWSVNYGKNWSTAELDHEIKADALTTVQDSTSLKFIITTEKQSGTGKYLILSINFEGVMDYECKENDFEDWYARIDGNGNPTCVMGQKQMYRRRKADVPCSIGKNFKDPVPRFEPCKCTDADYECDFNFAPTKDHKSCTPVALLTAPRDQCKDLDDEFYGSSGYRLIPGNGCVKEGGIVKDGLKKWPCSQAVNGPRNGNITTEFSPFEGSIVGHWYLEKKGLLETEDETVILRTSQDKVYISHDHGKTWKSPIKDKVNAILTNQYSSDEAYFLTQSTVVYYTRDRGQHIRKLKAPTLPSREVAQPLEFHPTERNWLVWLGIDECDANAETCRTKAYVSTDGGDEWRYMLSDTKKCEFMWKEKRNVSKQLVYCEQVQGKGSIDYLRLLSSQDWFMQTDIIFDSIVEFAQRSEFIIVATKDQVDQPFLHCNTSLDGLTFAPADFPPDFREPHQTGYNALDSSTHAIFLHVTVNGEEHGSIVKSNSNGTSYVLSISDVNRNHAGFVDFEKILCLEGIALVNVVDNIKEADGGTAKKKKTKITFNDGVDWFPLSPPKEDANGKGYKCQRTLDDCSLHLHGYTERRDFRNVYYSSTAVGLVIGVGNVGEYLTSYENGDTFISRNGGLDWKIARKGTFKWSYGDQGSIIVLVEDMKPTNVVYYSLDEGKSWITYQFSGSDFVINEITNLPSDTSRSFILWGKDTANGSQAVTFNLDFAGQAGRLCEMNNEAPGAGGDDYYRWEPMHPHHQHYADDEDNGEGRERCFFGHVAQYLRKKEGATCYNGKILINPRLDKYAKNCTCTRQDFECDYNYKRAKDQSCHLVDGLKPDPLRYCRENPDAIEYQEPTGYRQIPLTTCKGGKEMDLTSQSHPCPGKEAEFRKKSAVSTFRIFFAITIPFALAGGIGFYVWRNWDGKFGRIRLGESSAFDSSSPWIRWPVAVLSGFIAVFASTPLLLSSLWRNITGLLGTYTSSAYTSRGSFVRNTGAYTVVDNDEGDLFGEDSEDDD